MGTASRKGVSVTLSISGIDSRREKMAKTGFAYLFATLFCMLFGAVYEHFSHQVFSYYMVYAFVFPMGGGVLPFFSRLDPLPTAQQNIPKPLPFRHCRVDCGQYFSRGVRDLRYNQPAGFHLLDCRDSIYSVWNYILLNRF